MYGEKKKPSLLEEYFGLKGWWYEAYGNGGGFWHDRKHEQPKRGDPCRCARLLPKLDTSITQALVEADAEFGPRWTLSHQPSGHTFHVHRVVGANRIEQVVMEYGGTACEAVLKALIKGRKG